MPDSALYFPYIEVPRRPSLLPVLLYWDRLGSIVPSKQIASPRMRELIECDLVQPIMPDRDIWDVPHFDSALDNLVESVLRVATGPPHLEARIHHDKVGSRLMRRLRRTGLAQYEGGPWITADRRFTAAYMAFLAKCLGEVHGMEPVTDQQQAYLPLIGDDRADEVGERLNRARAAVSAIALPAPTVDVPPRELAKFKHDHWGALARFRGRIEQQLLDIASVDDPCLRDRRQELMVGQIRDEIGEIEDLMTRRGWPSKTAVLAAIVEGAPAALTFAGTLEPSEGAAALAPLAADAVRGAFGKPSFSGPLAYAVLARTQFASNGGKQRRLPGFPAR